MMRFPVSWILASKHKGSFLFNILIIRLIIVFVVSRMYRPNNEAVRGVWKKRHNEDINNLYSLRNINKFIKIIEIR
jgi:hypothetical protein